MHNLFDLKGTNNRGTLLSRYAALDPDFLSLSVPRGVFMITKNPSELLDPKHTHPTELYCKVNLVKLGYQVFIKIYIFHVHMI